MIDIIRFIIAGLVLIAGIAGYYLFPEQSLLLRTIGVIATIIIATLIAGFTARGKLFFGFINSSRQEMRKIIWPSKKEAHQTTLIVIVAVIILGLMLWAIDSILAASLSWLIG